MKREAGGRVLVVGGSKEYTGALYLAALSALRAGAESVIVMAPEKVAWALNALSPDLMTRKLKGEHLTARHRGQIKEHLKTADVLLLGNGATTRSNTAALMRSLMQWPGRKVVDADALKVLRGNQVSNAILTPNEGEWKMLQNHNSIPKLLRQNNVIIKKGFPTEIISAKRRFRMKRTNPGLKKAGTGDVLAGLCAGFLASGGGLFETAKKAADVGNRVADLLTKRKKGYVFLASDLIEELKRIQKKMILRNKER